ncbi:hypothetical protein [Kitasatospora sp. NPDC059327]|uniref:hypothetical protein n=1 Tax=Kitasatospora sp. NPDC059327 TaxID=3346803 RepID=UPI00367C6A9A
MNTPTPTTAPDSASADAPVPSRAESALDAVSLKVLRAPAVHRLLALRTEGALTRAHVRTTAQCLAVSDRTVWRWLAEAATAPATTHVPGERHVDRFEITPEIRVLLAYWRGNASAAAFAPAALLDDALRSLGAGCGPGECGAVSVPGDRPGAAGASPSGAPGQATG